MSAGLSVRVPSAEERRRHFKLVLRSVTFRNAPVLKSFLSFIVNSAEEGRADEISEYNIAIRVFGRPADFDPASDTIVRTQAYRLRLKLKEYYEGEGRNSDITIEIPKGHYVPVFDCKAPSSSTEDQPPPAVEPAVALEPALSETSSPSATARARANSWLPFISIALLVPLAFFVGAAIGARWQQRTEPAAKPAAIAPVVSQFWSGFLGSDRRVVVAFMDQPALTSDKGMILPLPPEAPFAERGVPADPRIAADPKLAAMAGPLYYENGYAGLGELLAVHQLGAFFQSFGAAAAITRAHQLTLDQLKQSDLIFLGGFEDRGTLVWMPQSWPWRFAFVYPPGVWDSYITDTAASHGASPRFGVERDRVSRAIRADHALITVMPGVVPSHRIISIAGITTSGTQGGAEFMRSETGLHELLAALGVKQNGRLVFPRYFQCVVRVEIAHGIDVMTARYATGAVSEPK